MKQHSKLWKTAEKETLWKLDTVPYMGKVMLTIFWDYKGPIHGKFMDGLQARINKNMYFLTLMHLRKTIQQKRKGLLTKNNVYCTTMPNHTWCSWFHEMWYNHDFCNLLRHFENTKNDPKQVSWSSDMWCCVCTGQCLSSHSLKNKWPHDQV